MHGGRRLAAGAVLLGAIGCARTVRVSTTPGAAAVRPGITVLVQDSIALVHGRRIALLTNQTGVDAARQSDIEILGGPAARNAGVRLLRLFSPEHGIRGTEDRQ